MNSINAMGLSVNIIDSIPSLLIVDDDDDFLSALAPAMSKRGFSVTLSNSAESAYQIAKISPPDFALIDLRLPGKSGLVLVRELAELNMNTQIVVLTGFACIATAIEAIKLGAKHYLAKPADADEITTSLKQNLGCAELDLPINPLTVNRLKWVHIQRILTLNNGNVSATARCLNMHRRTLQRKLIKKPSRN